MRAPKACEVSRSKANEIPKLKRRPNPRRGAIATTTIAKNTLLAATILGHAQAYAKVTKITSKPYQSINRKRDPCISAQGVNPLGYDAHG
jgi:hypothetical protein